MSDIPENPNTPQLECLKEVMIRESLRSPFLETFFTIYSITVCFFNFFVFSVLHYTSLKKFGKVFQPQVKTFLWIINVSLFVEVLYTTIVIGFQKKWDENSSAQLGALKIWPTSIGLYRFVTIDTIFYFVIFRMIQMKILTFENFKTLEEFTARMRWRTRWVYFIYAVLVISYILQIIVIVTYVAKDSRDENPVRGDQSTIWLWYYSSNFFCFFIESVMICLFY